MGWARGGGCLSLLPPPAFELTPPSSWSCPVTPMSANPSTEA